jgi:hypothetical protein
VSLATLGRLAAPAGTQKSHEPNGLLADLDRGKMPDVERSSLSVRRIHRLAFEGVY